MSFATLPHVSTRDGPLHGQVDEVVSRLTAVPGREGRLRHLEVVPPRPAVSVPWPAWVSGIWGALLVLDAFKTYGEAPISNQQIEEEMGRIRRR